MIKIHRQLSCVILCLPLILAACKTIQGKKIELQPCTLDDISAQCGVLSVYEDRASQSGRKIDIHVAVIKARSTDPAPDPIFYMAGGPGGSAIQDAAYAMLILGSANEKRDIVLVDQRGTGQSNRLTCPRSVEESLGMVPLDDAMIQDLKSCISNLDTDPAAYTTAWGMDDLDDVRTALGYDQINLYGESYGTMAQEIYNQRHGEHVRTMTLEGVSLIDVPIFEKMPRSSQQTIDFLVNRCQMDVACNQAYPNFDEEFAAVISRVEQQPVQLAITDPNTGRLVQMNRDMLVLGIHNILHNTGTMTMLPRLIHQAYQGDWNEIGQIYASNFSNPDGVEWVIMNMTILCNEDWARMDPSETAQFASGSYLNYEDVRRYTVPEAVCALFTPPEDAAIKYTYNPSMVPVLLINNQADFQNPLENLADANEHYPNSLTVIAPAQGHGYTGMECRVQFVTAFIDTGTTEGLDTGCLEHVSVPPFNVSK